MLLISEAPEIVKCFYEQSERYTLHQWQTFFCMPEESLLMREAIEIFLNFVKENNVCKHIVDVKKCTDAFTESDLNYIIDYLVPTEVAYGIKYLANIVSDDLVTQISTEFWQEKVENGLLVKNFPNMEEAVEWLKNK